MQANAETVGLLQIGHGRLLSKGFLVYPTTFDVTGTQYI
jgi:hypothetical protein